MFLSKSPCMFPVYLFNFNIVVILSYSFHVKYIYDDMFKSSSANRELIVAPIDNLFNHWNLFYWMCISTCELNSSIQIEIDAVRFDLKFLLCKILRICQLNRFYFTRSLNSWLVFMEWCWWNYYGCQQSMFRWPSSAELEYLRLRGSDIVCLNVLFNSRLSWGIGQHMLVSV